VLIVPKNIFVFAIAILLSADAAALFGWSVLRYLAVPVFIIALLHGLILGLPTYLIVRRSRSVTALLCTLGGLCIGALPILTITLLRSLVPNDAQDAPNAYTITVIEPWSDVILFGLHGAIAGLTFFLALRFISNESGWQRRMSGALLAGVILTGLIVTMAPRLEDAAHAVSGERR
jgi:hypothetical protein